MKVLQIHNRYRLRGGEDVVVDAEFELLRGGGHDVIRYQVANPRSDGAAGVTLAGAPWNPFQARKVQGLVEQHRPDVVHVHNTWFALSPAVIRAAYRAGAPVVATMHNYRVTCANGLLFRQGQPCELCLGSSPFPGMRYSCYRGTIPSTAAAATILLHRRLATWVDFVDRLVVPTRFTQLKLTEVGLPAERLVVRAGHVGDPGPRSIGATESDTILFVGRLSEEKGLDVLLEAWRSAAPHDLKLKIIGDGPMHVDLRGEMPPNAYLLGSLPAETVTAMMLAARALVFPSLAYETMGRVLLEALAAGVPTLVSDQGSAAEIAGSLEPQWRVPPGSVKEWSAALTRLDDTRFVHRGSQQARSLYEASYAPHRALTELEAIYEEARRSLKSR